MLTFDLFSLLQDPLSLLFRSFDSPSDGSSASPPSPSSTAHFDIDSPKYSFSLFPEPLTSPESSLDSSYSDARSTLPPSGRDIFLVGSHKPYRHSPSSPPSSSPTRSPFSQIFPSLAFEVESNSTSAFNGTVSRRGSLSRNGALTRMAVKTNQSIDPSTASSHPHVHTDIPSSKVLNDLVVGASPAASCQLAPVEPVRHPGRSTDTVPSEHCERPGTAAAYSSEALVDEASVGRSQQGVRPLRSLTASTARQLRSQTATTGAQRAVGASATRDTPVTSSEPPRLAHWSPQSGKGSLGKASKGKRYSPMMAASSMPRPRRPTVEGDEVKPKIRRKVACPYITPGTTERCGSLIGLYDLRRHHAEVHSCPEADMIASSDPDLPLGDALAYLEDVAMELDKASTGGALGCQAAEVRERLMEKPTSVDLTGLEEFERFARMKAPAHRRFPCLVCFGSELRSERKLQDHLKASHGMHLDDPLI